MHTRGRAVRLTVRVTTLKGHEAGLYVEGLPSYYLDAGEPAGVWRGAARFLGMEGEVGDEDFLRLAGLAERRAARPSLR